MSKRNPCYTGPQVPSAQGHVHTVRCNPNPFVSNGGKGRRYPQIPPQNLRMFEELAEAGADDFPDWMEESEPLEEAIARFGRSRKKMAAQAARLTYSAEGYTQEQFKELIVAAVETLDLFIRGLENEIEALGRKQTTKKDRQSLRVKYFDEHPTIPVPTFVDGAPAGWLVLSKPGGMWGQPEFRAAGVYGQVGFSDEKGRNYWFEVKDSFTYERLVWGGSGITLGDVLGMPGVRLTSVDPPFDPSTRNPTPNPRIFIHGREMEADRDEAEEYLVDLGLSKSQATETWREMRQIEAGDPDDPADPRPLLQKLYRQLNAQAVRTVKRSRIMSMGRYLDFNTLDRPNPDQPTVIFDDMERKFVLSTLNEWLGAKGAAGFTEYDPEDEEEEDGADDESEEWPSLLTIAKALARIQRGLDEGEAIEVRLQVVPSEGFWAIHEGDSSYDTDHRGVWGASSIDTEVAPAEVAEDLLRQARQAYNS